MARDPDTIQREIEKARDALAESLDVLSERASPKRFVDQGRASLQQRLADPKIKYGLMALGVVVAARGVAQALPLTTGGARPRAGDAPQRAPSVAGQLQRGGAVGAVLQRGRGSARRSARRRSPRRPPAVRRRAGPPPCPAPRRPRGRRRAAAAGCRRVPACRGAGSSARTGRTRSTAPAQAGAARRGCRAPRWRPGRLRWSSARGGAGRRGRGRSTPRRRPPPTRRTALRPARSPHKAGRRGRALAGAPSTHPSRGTPPIPSTTTSAVTRAPSASATPSCPPLWPAPP